MYLQLAKICRGHYASFTILCFKWSVKEHCIARILLAFWVTFLYENNCNFNSYTVSYKLAFKPFFVLSYEPKIRIDSLESLWSGNEKYFCHNSHNEDNNLFGKQT